MTKLLCLLAGAAVFAAAAVPAVGRSSSRVTPTRLTRTTKPQVGHTYPWRLRTFGKVVVPRGSCLPGLTDPAYCADGVNRKKACRGRVRIVYTLGRKVLSRKTTSVTKACAYSRRVTFTDRRLAGRRLTVQARFLGNAVLKPRSSPRGRIRLG